MPSHTEAPWETQTEPDAMYGAGCIVAQVDPSTAYRIVARCLTDANARRIVACVNACAGIDTEQLERGPGRSAGHGGVIRCGQLVGEFINTALVEALETSVTAMDAALRHMPDLDSAPPRTKVAHIEAARGVHKAIAQALTALSQASVQAHE